MADWEAQRRSVAERLSAETDFEWAADALAAGVEPHDIARRRALADRVHAAMGELEVSLDHAPWAFDDLLRGRTPDPAHLRSYERAQATVEAVLAEVKATI